MTVPQSVGQIKMFYNHQPSHYFRNYVNNKTGALFSFGYGLSYSTFEYAKPLLSSAAININESIEVSIEIKNVSTIYGEEVVQLYIHDEYASISRPVKELKDFKRIAIKAGQTQKVSFTITPDMLSFLDIDMKPTIEKGTFIAMIGSSSRDEDLKKIEFVVE